MDFDGSVNTYFRNSTFREILSINVNIGTLQEFVITKANWQVHFIHYGMIEGWGIHIVFPHDDAVSWREFSEALRIEWVIYHPIAN